MVTVTNSTDLNIQLAAATGGETIECTQGADYAITTTYTPASKVTVKSSNTSAPARFTSIQMINSSNVAFEDIHCFYQHVTGHNERQILFEIKDSTDVTFTRTLFEGTLAVESDGNELFLNEPAGKGLTLDSCVRSQLIDCDFHTWWNALNLLSNGGISQDCKIAGCNFYNIRADIFALGESNSTLVEYNWFHDMFEGSGTEHRDFLQLRGAHGLIDGAIIRSNIFDSGSGGWGQSVFSGVDGRSPTEWHTNVTVDNNIIYIADKHAITLNQFDGGTVTNNTTIQRVGGSVAPTVPIPRILMENQTKNIVLTANIAETIGGTSIANCDVTGGNSIVALAAYGTEYDQIKTDAVDGYNQYQFKSGGSLSTAGHGAQAINDAYPFDNLTWIRSRGGSTTPPVSAGLVTLIGGAPMVDANGRILLSS